MPYELTFWSKQYVARTGRTTRDYKTAAETLKAYDGLVMSDETVEIRDQHGRETAYQELKMLVKREAGGDKPI